MKAGANIRVILLTTCLGLLFGCRKKLEGCMDTTANNNCHGCNQATNEVCEYTSDGVFWYESYVGDSLEASGTHSLSYYIDGQLMGTTPIYHGYWWTGGTLTGGPTFASCTDDSTFKYTKTWKGNRDHSFNYSVKNQTGLELWSGSESFHVYGCSSTELKF